MELLHAGSDKLMAPPGEALCRYAAFCYGRDGAPDARKAGGKNVAPFKRRGCGAPSGVYGAFPPSLSRIAATDSLSRSLWW